VDWHKLKMASESTDEYQERVIAPLMAELGFGKERAEQQWEGVRFDYSMTDKPQPSL
jgi:hypothetical protein